MVSCAEYTTGSLLVVDPYQNPFHGLRGQRNQAGIGAVGTLFAIGTHKADPGFHRFTDKHAGIECMRKTVARSPAVVYTDRWVSGQKATNRTISAATALPVPVLSAQLNFTRLPAIATAVGFEAPSNTLRLTCASEKSIQKGESSPITAFWILYDTAVPRHMGCKSPETDRKQIDHTRKETNSQPKFLLLPKLSLRRYFCFLGRQTMHNRSALPASPPSFLFYQRTGRGSPCYKLT